MRLKNTLIAIVVLLSSGATVSFAQESHIGNVQGRASAGKALYRRYCIGCHGPQGEGAGENTALGGPKPRRLTAGTVKGQVKTQLGSIPSRATSRPLRLSAVRRPPAHCQPTRTFTMPLLVG